jgi:hypothetical protein
MNFLNTQLFWLKSMLSEEEQRLFENLQTLVDSPSCKYNRNRKRVTFAEIFAAIWAFIHLDDRDKWIRCLLCGICPLDDTVAICVQRLAILLGQSKSSVNGMFTEMGYKAAPMTVRKLTTLQQIIRALNQPQEIRKWTIRKLLPKRTQTLSPLTKPEFARKLKLERMQMLPILDSEPEPEPEPEQEQEQEQSLPPDDERVVHGSTGWNNFPMLELPLFDNETTRFESPDWL